MTYRQLTLRFVGLCVAAAVLVAATQTLKLSVESDPVLGRDGVRDVTRWIGREHSGGAEVLVGLGLIALACWLVWTFIASLRTDQKVLRARRGDGWTRIDRRTLADSLQRSLAAVDSHAAVFVEVRRTGRVDVTMASSSPRPDERLEETRAELDRLIEQRSLPCRPGRMAIKAPRRNTRSRVQ